jgi:hypothetical protein
MMDRFYNNKLNNNGRHIFSLNKMIDNVISTVCFSRAQNDASRLLPINHGHGASVTRSLWEHVPVTFRHEYQLVPNGFRVQCDGSGRKWSLVSSGSPD